MLLSVSHRIWLLALRSLLFTATIAEFSSVTIGQAADTTGDYLIDVWDTEHDLPSSIVTDIAQTPDGYLWVGTYDGLARFDGVRFVRFDPVNTPELSVARIQALYLDAQGTLWINTYRGGLTSYRSDRADKFHREWGDQPYYDLHTWLVSSTSNSVVFVTQYGEVLRRATTGTNQNWNVSTPTNSTRPIFQCADGDGKLWFLTREGRITRFIEGEFKDLPADGGLADKKVNTLVTDARGRVWAGATNEIACWDGRQFQTMTPTNGEPNIDPVLLAPTREGAMWVLANDRLRKLAGRRWVAEAVEWRRLLGAAGSRVMGVHEDRDGGMWFNHYGNGLFHITPDGRYQRLTSQDGLPGDRVGAWFQGRDGGVWLGIDRGGLARLRDRRFHVIGLSEGRATRPALSVCEDRDGAIWIGTGGGGLCRWDGERITRFPVTGNTSENFVFSLFPRPDGGIWLSAKAGEELFEFQGDQMQRAPWDAARGVKSILADQAGRIWTGTKAGLAWWSGGTRRLFGASDGLASSAVRALTEAPDGTVWCGADDGTLYRCEPDRLQPFRATDALTNQPIWSLWADRDGAIWAGTFRGGLLRFKNGKFSRITTKQGLPADIIGQILEDRQGRLWLGTHQGICCVAKSALDACADGRTNAVDCVTYGKLDGLPTPECSDGYQPACWRGRDGRLWFATLKGVVSVNPDELSANSLPPPVVIEEMQVDGELLELGAGKLVVPPAHKQFDFRFTALGFNAPDKMRFRYRIEGWDSDWVEGDPERRTAHYGHLPPRDYRFHVIARNNDGVWNDAGAIVKFTVQPHLYQTWWFLTLVSVGVLAAVGATVRSAATRKYRRDLARLEQQHAIERDRTRIAKDIHDDIGAGLTQITLLSELARREPEQAGAHLDRISDSARQLTRAMDEIVWAVDPQHDTFNGLMDYMSAFAEDFLRMAGIRCRMDLPTTLPVMSVDAELRYNLFLALKEVLNNIVKHAHATEVWLRLRIEPKAFTLVVEDNGQGLPSARAAGTASMGSDRISSGSGLTNLEKRLNGVGGRCIVQSDPGRGTRVEMIVAMPELASPVVASGRNGLGQIGWQHESLVDES